MSNTFILTKQQGLVTALEDIRLMLTQSDKLQLLVNWDVDQDFLQTIFRDLRGDYKGTDKKLLIKTEVGNKYNIEVSSEEKLTGPELENARRILIGKGYGTKSDSLTILLENVLAKAEGIRDVSVDASLIKRIQAHGYDGKLLRPLIHEVLTDIHRCKFLIKERTGDSAESIVTLVENLLYRLNFINNPNYQPDPTDVNHLKLMMSDWGWQGETLADKVEWIKNLMDECSAQLAKAVGSKRRMSLKDLCSEATGMLMARADIMQTQHHALIAKETEIKELKTKIEVGMEALQWQGPPETVVEQPTKSRPVMLIKDTDHYDAIVEEIRKYRKSHREVVVALDNPSPVALLTLVEQLYKTNEIESYKEVPKFYGTRYKLIFPKEAAPSAPSDTPYIFCQDSDNFDQVLERISAAVRHGDSSSVVLWFSYKYVVSKLGETLQRLQGVSWVESIVKTSSAGLGSEYLVQLKLKDAQLEECVAEEIEIPPQSGEYWTVSSKLDSLYKAGHKVCYLKFKPTCSTPFIIQMVTELRAKCGRTINSCEGDTHTFEVIFKEHLNEVAEASTKKVDTPYCILEDPNYVVNVLGTLRDIGSKSAMLFVPNGMKDDILDALRGARWIESMTPDISQEHRYIIKFTEKKEYTPVTSSSEKHRAMEKAYNRMKQVHLDVTATDTRDYVKAMVEGAFSRGATVVELTFSVGAQGFNKFKIEKDLNAEGYLALHSGTGKMIVHPKGTQNAEYHHKVTTQTETIKVWPDTRMSRVREDFLKALDMGTPTIDIVLEVETPRSRMYELRDFVIALGYSGAIIHSGLYRVDVVKSNTHAIVVYSSTDINKVTAETRKAFHDGQGRKVKVFFAEGAHILRNHIEESLVSNGYKMIATMDSGAFNIIKS